MATKFVSALTGPEMDQALTDMAYHNSEAYAVGTRNGVAVGSSDVTYHNNSKYWAEQVYGYTDRAEDAANRAEAAVPAGTAGAVFFDRAQTLTTAQQAQARANIMAGGSNRNLLDNPWFTVNQRGLTSYAVSNAYTVDRWKERGNATITVNSDGTLTIPADTSYGFQQTMSWMPSTGETITVTALHSDGTVSTKTLSMPSSSYLSAYTNGISFVINPTQKIFAMLTNTEVTLKAVKFELGSVSTLANDAPPNYAEELEKCKYYCRVVDFDTDVSVGIGWAFSNSGAVIPNIFGFGNEMRAVPTVTSTGSFVLRTTGGSNINVTSFAIGASVQDAISLNASVASGLTANQPVRLQAGTGAKLVFSADL